MGTESQPHLADGLIDDYESFGREFRETPHKDEAALYVPSMRGPKSQLSHILSRSYQTEASTSSANHEVVILRSGAWKTCVVPDIPLDKTLMFLKVDVALFLRTHKQDNFRVPSCGGCRSAIATVLLSSFNVFFGNGSRCFQWNHRS